MLGTWRWTLACAVHGVSPTGTAAVLGVSPTGTAAVLGEAAL